MKNKKNKIKWVKCPNCNAVVGDLKKGEECSFCFKIYKPNKLKPTKPTVQVKLFVISSTKFKTLCEAKRQMEEWEDEGSLDSKARIYEVKKCYKVKFPKPIVEEERI